MMNSERNYNRENNEKINSNRSNVLGPKKGSFTVSHPSFSAS